MQLRWNGLKIGNETNVHERVDSGSQADFLDAHGTRCGVLVRFDDQMMATVDKFIHMNMSDMVPRF